MSVPIVPGLMPVLSLKQIKRITELCQAKLPISLISRLRAGEGDPVAQMNVGVDHATRQVEGLLKADCPGVHFYVLNKSEAAVEVLRAVQLPTNRR